MVVLVAVVVVCVIEIDVAVADVTVAVVLVTVVAVTVVLVTVDVVQRLQSAGQVFDRRSVEAHSPKTNFLQPSGSSTPLHSGISTQVPQVIGQSFRTASPFGVGFSSSKHKFAKPAQLGLSATPLHNRVVVVVVAVSVTEVVVVGQVSHNTGQLRRVVSPRTLVRSHRPLSS